MYFVAHLVEIVDYGQSMDMDMTMIHGHGRTSTRESQGVMCDVRVCPAYFMSAIYFSVITPSAGLPTPHSSGHRRNHGHK
jgi:hypothetical protein